MAWQHDPSPPEPAQQDPKAQQRLRELVGDLFGASELEDLEGVRGWPRARRRKS